MSIDLQLSRRLVAWGLGIAALTPFLFCLEAPTEHRDLSTVSGRVTYFGHPMSNMMICLDSGGTHSALGLLQDDGSFQLVNFQYNQLGTFQGRYHAHLTPYTQGSDVPAKYKDSGTAGLEIEVATDWNYLDIELR